MSGRYAFVIPRVAPGIGGAETLIISIAARLAARGDTVKIFTTTAKDNRSWSNHFPPGLSLENGITVERFPVDERSLDVWIPLQIKIHNGEELTAAEELDWLRNGVNSEGLYAAIVKEYGDFDFFFFAPYLFATTFWGALLVADKAVLIPCLHDESYAYTKSIYYLFRRVTGFIFNCDAERSLARKIYGSPDGISVGVGFEIANRLEHTDFFDGKFPYIFYLGRKETGKNAQLALDYFVQAKDEGKLPGELRFVVAGPGSFSDLERDTYLARTDIIDLPPVSDQDKERLFQHAVAAVQPSRNESFSIVIMEAWLQKCPVLVHGLCEVTREHVENSGGGLYFSDYSDFHATVNFLMSRREAADEMAVNGRRYVEEVYCWEAVMSRFGKAVSYIRLRMEGFNEVSRTEVK